EILAVPTVTSIGIAGDERLLVLAVERLQLLHLPLVILDHLLVLRHPAECGLDRMRDVHDRPLRRCGTRCESAQPEHGYRQPPSGLPRQTDFPVAHVPLPGLIQTDPPPAGMTRAARRPSRAAWNCAS